MRPAICQSCPCLAHDTAVARFLLAESHGLAPTASQQGSIACRWATKRSDAGLELTWNERPRLEDKTHMKLITAIVNPYKLEDVREAISALGIQGMTVTEVKGFGRQRGHAELYRGAEYTVDYRPKVKVEIAAGGDDVDRVVEAIVQAARTGRVGDGKIFVTGLDQGVRVRTGEAGEVAL